MVDWFAGPWGPLVIFLLRVVDVSIATVRIILVVRGPRWVAPIVGFFEVLIWVLAVGAAIQNLSSPLHVVAYAGGYAVGTSVGLWVERKLALGIGVVRTISKGNGAQLAERLRAEGFGVTEQDGRGRSGPLSVLYTVARRRHIPDVLRIIEAEDPSTFVTVQMDATVRRGWLARARHL